MHRVAVWAAIVVLVVAARLTHADLLWVEEAYGAAAAAQLLDGKVLYRDVWFDKPPLYALVYLLWGAHTGFALRLAGSAWVLLACIAAYLFARHQWSEREGLIAAALLAFYLTFGLPSAVMALAPDLLAIPFHLGAMLCAARGQALAAGALSGAATLANPKGIFVLLAVMLWTRRSAWRAAAGFAAVSGGAAAVLAAMGALGDHLAQVWVWGARYSADTFVANPLAEFLRRTAGWAGFHAALVVGAALCFGRERPWRLVAWAGVSLLAVSAGLRFFPRYYFHLLPVVTVAAARGLVIAPRWLRAVALASMLIPAVRFGPRYVQLAVGAATGWSDTALDRDSREAAALLKRARPESTLLVWGYRPEVYVYSRLPAATRFLDSQPLTGVLADRHLVDSRPTFAAEAAGHRAELTRSSPAFIVDGLGPLNPRLAISAYPDLASWLERYEVAGRTRFTVVYRLRAPHGPALR